VKRFLRIPPRADDSRKGLADAVARCAAGDVLVAWKIDRLGRSTLDLVGLVEKLKGRSVGLKVLKRTMAGMRAAKRRGRHVGRPRKLTAHKLDHARQLIADGKETRAGAATLLGVDAVTLRRALNGPDDLGGSPARANRPASARAGKRV
jgi:DNA invertase Pin-like site-specific DNA recombinase